MQPSTRSRSYSLLGVVVIAMVAVPTLVAAYRHARDVVGSVGDPVMAPWLPASIVGLLLAGTGVIWMRRRSGAPVGWVPWGAAGFAMVVLTGANLATVHEPSVLAYAVALFPPIALVVTLEVVATTRLTDAPGPTPAELAGDELAGDELAGSGPAESESSTAETPREPVVAEPVVAEPVVPERIGSELAASEWASGPPVASTLGTDVAEPAPAMAVESTGQPPETPASTSPEPAAEPVRPVVRRPRGQTTRAQAASARTTSARTTSARTTSAPTARTPVVRGRAAGTTREPADDSPPKDPDCASAVPPSSPRTRTTTRTTAPSPRPAARRPAEEQRIVSEGN